MKIKVLMLTHNRTSYTRITLGGLLDSLPDYANVTVWDNASGPELRKVLDEFRDHPRLEEVYLSDQNLKLRDPTNWFWEKSKDCDFVSKVDDDCLLSKGWVESLVEHHEDFPDSGVIGTWRFYPEDNEERDLEPKIRKGESKSIFLNCWVQGSGYLLRRSVIDRMGLIQSKESFPHYCIRAAKKGYVNGFAYPFIFEDHFDDPRSKYSEIRTQDDLDRYMPLTAKQFGVKTVEQWLEHNRDQAKILEQSPYDPSHYIGFKVKARNGLKRIRNMFARK